MALIKKLDVRPLGPRTFVFDSMPSNLVAESVRPGDYVQAPEGGALQYMNNNFVLQSTSGVLHKNTTAVGNVGAGPDALMQFTLLANTLRANGLGLKITAWGTTANNVNAKTLALIYGATTIQSESLTVSIDGRWVLEAYIIRTASDAQDIMSKLQEGTATLAAGKISVGSGTATEDDDADKVIKLEATTVTADNDIVQEGMIIELI